MSKVIIRPFDPTQDSGLIYSSFPKGVYYGATAPFKHTKVEKDEWFTQFYQYLKKQLTDSIILMACLESDPSTILGYSIVDKDQIEFVYVKEKFRKQGIASLLTRNLTKHNNSTLTKVGNAILQKQISKGNTDEPIRET